MADYREICEQYSCENLIHWRNLTQNVKSIIKSNFGINDDEIHAFYDSSIFQNRKVGLVICDSGIYYRNSFQNPYYLTWKQVRTLKFTYSNQYLYFGDNSVSIFSSGADTLAQMITNIRMNAKIDNIVEKTTGFLGFLESAANWLSELDTSNQTQEQESLGVADVPMTQKSLTPPVVTTTPKVPLENPRWSIAYKGKTYGPFSTEEAKDWTADNYDGTDKIYAFKKGMQTWELMNTLNEFSSFLDEVDYLPPLPY